MFKQILRLILVLCVLVVGLFNASDTYAACSGGSTSTTAGMSLQSNGCYQDGAGRQYSFVPASAGNAPVLGDTTPANENDNIYNKSVTDLRSGNFTLSDVPLLIVNMIEFLLFFVGTVCVVAIIYHAVRMQLASGIMGDSSWVDKAKKWIYGAMMGFLLSMSAWFIMTKLVSIFGAIS